MNRAAAFLVLLTVSVAAGAWLFTPGRPLPTVSAPAGAPSATSCGEEAVCGTVVPAPGEPQAVAPPPEPPPVPAAPAAPPPPDSPASQPAVPVPDAEELRAEADRLLAQGHVVEGVEAMRKAVKADPSARNHGDLGALLQKLTDFDGAVIHLSRAADLDPGNADRWIALANAHYLDVNPGAAWKAERRAQAAEPGLVLGRGPDGLRVRKDDSAAGKK